MKAFAIRGSLTVTATAGNDYITIRSRAENPDFIEVMVNGQRQYAGLWSALTGITINATAAGESVLIDNTVAGTPVILNLGNGNDIVLIGGTAEDQDAIQGRVTIHGGPGSDTLIIPDEYNAASTTYAIAASSVSRIGSAGISYDHISALNLFGGFGNDTYNVLGSLQGQLNLTAGLGSNTLNIDDGSASANTTYTVTGSSVARTGSGAISYSGNVTSLVVTGGSGNDTYNVMGSLSTGPTTLNTGNGVDTVNVRGAAGPLFLNSGSGGDTITLSNSTTTLGGIGHVIINDPSNSAAVTVDDSGFAGSTTYTLTSTQVAAAAWPNFFLSYNNVASLNLNGGSGDDSFDIESTAGATATTVTAASGSNRFDLTPTAQYLAGVAGPLNLLGSGADTLVFWDTANPNAETYTFDDVPSNLTLATVPVSVNFFGMAAVYLETNGMSTVNDPSGTVIVDMLPPAPPMPVAQPPGYSPDAVEGLLPAWFGPCSQHHANLMLAETCGTRAWCQTWRQAWHHAWELGVKFWPKRNPGDLFLLRLCRHEAVWPCYSPAELPGRLLAAKKSARMPRQRSAKTPPSTCARWFKRGSLAMRNSVSHAPALESAVP
jgi:hypothetical protein